MGNKPDRYDSEELGYSYGLGIFELILSPFIYLINWMLGNKSRNNEMSFGEGSFIGEVVEVIDVIVKDEGVKYLVRADGEIWNLLCSEDLSKGDEVSIIDSDGLSLMGEKVS